jgi:hypothetical protein
MSDRMFIVVGTAGTPNNVGVMQVGVYLYPVCGNCLQTSPFPDEPDTDDLKWVCVACGYDYADKLEGKTCDLALHWATQEEWMRRTVSAWTGYPEDQLVLGRA